MKENKSIKPKKSGSVLIVGGGIGGMQAALDLANAGYKIHLVQKESAIGGTMVMLDKTFPTGDCAMCMISPKMVELGRHPDIDLYTLAEVISVEGETGEFTAKIRQHPRYVDPELCTGCGICEEKCPKKVRSEYEQGLTVRKAIYSLFPQALPNTRAINRPDCIYFKNGKCKACEKFCPSGAIKWDDTEKVFDVKAGAIILSPGLDRYDPTVRQELGLGRWPNVVTSIQFERILSASGPNQGVVKRPGDGKHPRKIAWIQCVGSRDSHNANPWCSSVCCMYTTKQAIIAKEHDRLIEPTVFYMEMRAFGKDFDKYIDRAKDQFGIRYQRAMISAVQEESGTGDLIFRYAKEDGTLVDETFDMAVLSVGLEPRIDAEAFARIFSIEPNEYQFAKTNEFNPVATSRPGIFVAGTYQGPKDIPETVMQGSAVAGSTMALLGESRGTEIMVKKLPPEREVNTEERRVGLFVCHCGVNISQTVDVKKVAKEGGELPDVVLSEDMLYACAQDSQERIKKLVREKKLNRVVVASCTPRTHEPLFQETIRDAGINKYLFELADIREQCSWCHMGQNKVATEKAMDIVKMNVAKARLLEPVQTGSVDVTHAAMIIGGGIAAMVAAISLADQGHRVHLVEKENRDSRRRHRRAVA
ncbi:MAG: FAD-dependent oxidoreductase, partial [Desulfobacterales bacterium]